MKKFLALLMAALMLFSMTAAFAENEPTGDNGTGTPVVDGTTPEDGTNSETTTPQTFFPLASDATVSGSFTKEFINLLPVGDQLTFKAEFFASKYSATAPASALIDTTITHIVTDAANLVNTINFTAKKPAAYGSYVYKITETSENVPTTKEDGSTEYTTTNENVELDDEALYIVVMYYLAEEEVPATDTTKAYTKYTEKLEVSLISEPEQPVQSTGLDGEARVDDADQTEGNKGKNDQFENTYKTSDIEITKVITGNAADHTDNFNATLTLTSTNPFSVKNIKWNDEAITLSKNDTYADGYQYTATVEIGGAASSTYKLTGVPLGVYVDIEENSGADNMQGYSATYKVGTTDLADGGVAVTDDTSDNITITNQKDVDIPTGVVMDYIPYVILLVVAVAGLAGFVLKRRMAADNDD